MYNILLNRVIGITATSTLLLGMASVAYAVDTIQFTGRVVDESCVVDVASSGNLTVALGDVPKSSLSGAGTKSPDTPFSIALTGCPADDAQISLTFDGTPNTANPSLLKVVAGTGTAATGVGIAIFDNTTGTPDATPLDITTGATSKPLTTDATGKAKFDFIANIMNDGSTVAAGDANSSATVTVNYQ